MVPRTTAPIVRSICTVAMPFSSFGRRFQLFPEKGEAKKDPRHSREDEVVRPENDQAEKRRPQPDEGRPVILRFHPPVQVNNHKKGGHGKIDAGSIKGQERPGNTFKQRSAYPVKAVENCDENLEPPLVHTLRWLHGAVDGKGLIAHSEDQEKLLSPGSPVFIQHRNAVEEMPCIDHQGQKKA